MIKYFLGFLFFLCSCASSDFYRLEKQNIPLNVLKKMAEDILPQGLKQVSPNGREFYSQYFIEDKGLYKPYKEGGKT